MSLKAKRILIAVLGFVFLASLLLVQWMEIVRKQEEAGLVRAHPSDLCGGQERLHHRRSGRP